VRGAQLGVQDDARARGGQPHAELDVLHHRGRVAVDVEAAGGQERVAADGAEPGPERGRLARRGLVHVVVEEVSELRDGPTERRPVVVGAEHCGQAGVGAERLADASERVGVDLDVRVDEHQDLAACHRRAGVARRRRAAPGLDHEHLVVRPGRRLDRGHHPLERRRTVRRRHDDAEPPCGPHPATLCPVWPNVAPCRPTS